MGRRKPLGVASHKRPLCKRGYGYARSSAPKRSPRAATIAERRRPASSSESVRSGDWKETETASDFLPAGMEERVGRPLERRLGLERGIERLDSALRVEEVALGEAGDAEPLVRQVAAGQVDARELEQRDPFDAGVEVVLRRLDEARQQAR